MNRNSKLLLAGIIIVLTLCLIFVGVKTVFKDKQNFFAKVSLKNNDKKDERVSKALKEALKGEELYKEKNFFECISHFRKAIAINPNYAEAYYKLGKTLAQMERYEEAIDSHQKAVKLNFNESLLELAVIYEYLGLYNKAVDNYQKYQEALQSYPDSTFTHKKSDGRHAGFGKLKNSAPSTIDPEEAEAFYEYGSKLGQMERYKEAVYMYKAAIRRKTDFPKAYYNLGISFERLNEYEEAIKAFERAVFYEPQYAAAYKKLGGIYTVLKNKKLAVDNLQKAAFLFLMDNKRNEAMDVLIMLRIVAPDFKIETKLSSLLKEMSK